MFNSRPDVIFTPIKSLVGLILGVYIPIYPLVATPLQIWQSVIWNSTFDTIQDDGQVKVSTLWVFFYSCPKMFLKLHCLLLVVSGECPTFSKPAGEMSPGGNVRLMASTATCSIAMVWAHRENRRLCSRKPCSGTDTMPIQVRGRI